MKEVIHNFMTFCNSVTDNSQNEMPYDSDVDEDIKAKVILYDISIDCNRVNQLPLQTVITPTNKV
jgi:hypothetical protein